MIVKQIYTQCLAQGAYFMASQAEAVIIDPLREFQPYLDLAASNNAKIKYILLTHFHADFVSGHVDLAKKTGATIVLGPNAQADYDFYSAKEGDTFSIGNLKLQILHTPGHTMESSCYLLFDEEGKEQALFTGDTLFIGDVGRPDLAVKSHLTTADLAGHLYDSLHNKIMSLPDDITIYPAHGAGSACGKNMSSETSDTLGNQKKTNYALNSSLTRDEFIKEVSSGLALPPVYFPLNVAMNKTVNKSFEDVLEQGTKPLSVDEFKRLRKQEDVLVLDTRSNSAFAKAHIPKSWFIGLNGQFAPWVGTLIPNIKQKLIILADSGKEKEVVTRLARVGYDNTLGYLEGGIEAWQNSGKSIENIEEMNAQLFVDKLGAGEINNALDVRKDAEFKTSHIEEINHIPLSQIHQKINNLNADETYHIHCAGGYRSLIFASIAKAKGIQEVVNISGGYGAIKKSQLKNLKLT